MFVSLSWRVVLDLAGGVTLVSLLDITGILDPA